MKKTLFLLILIIVSELGYAQWQKVTPPTALNINRVIHKSGVLMACGDSMSFFKSTDNGLTWQVIRFNVPNQFNHYPATRISFSNATTGYISGYGRGLCRKTSDGGVTWQQEYGPDPFGASGTYSLGHYYSSGAAKAGGFVNIDTTNGYPYGAITVVPGQNINVDTSGNPVAIGYPIMFADYGNTLYLNSTYISKKVGGGAWSTVSPSIGYDYHKSGWCFTSADTGFFATGYLLYKTTDGAVTWNQVVTGASNSLNDVKFYNNQIGYAVGDSGTIVKTVDGGQTWTSESCIGLTENLNSVEFISATDVVIVGEKGTVLLNNQTPAVWPGDANSNLVADNYDVLPIGLLFNTAGPARATVSNLWQSFTSTSWGAFQANCADIKHADCNGDGIINYNDTVAISQNFGLTHPLRLQSNQHNSTSGQLSFFSASNMYAPNTWVDVEVWAGDVSNPMQQFYGLAADISFSSSIIEPATASFNFTNAWAGTAGIDAIGFSNVSEANGLIKFAFVRTSHTDTSGYGKIGTMRFKTNASISTLTPSTISLTKNLAVSSDQSGLQLNNPAITITVDPLLATNNLVNDMPEIYPNPFGNILHFKLKANAAAEQISIKIYNSIGEQVLKYEPKTTDFIIETQNFSEGIYFLEIITRTGTYRNKMVKLK